ncbi:MAG: lysophospholipid acyltransferase family protein [Pseudomonadota bacterium]
MRSLISAFKIFIFVIISLFAVPFSILWGVFFYQSKYYIIAVRAFHSLTCKIFGIKIKVKGQPETKNVFYICNHISYIDIPVLGSILPTFFVARKGVANWPLLGLLARITGTVFIGQKKHDQEDSRNKILNSLQNGKNLVFFPEGTSTKGKTVYPFKSSSFEIFLNSDTENIILQPCTIQILKIDNNFKFEEKRDFYAWHGDMTFIPHLWNFGKLSSITIQLTFHTPFSSKRFHSRKEIAVAAFNAVKAPFSETSS